MTIQEIIDSLEDQAEDKDRLAGGDPDSIFTHDADVLLEAVRLLKKQDSDNAPLTLDELREMGSDMYSLMYSPVWIECKKSQMYNWTGYDLIAVHNELIISALDRLLSIRDYGDSWLAYRRKPEEGTT